MVDKKLSEFSGVETTEVASFPVLDKSTKNRVLSAARVMTFTNCITDIPQDIKLELVSGTLTLKSGSKVYVPNGSGVFDEYSITSDKTYTFTSGTSTRLLFYNRTAGTLSSTTINNCFSGSDAPTGSGTIYWYDTTNNLVKRSDNGGSTWINNSYSLPIGVIQVTSGSITSIEKVFNGFGYIGKTIFSLPGIKGLYPNGRYDSGVMAGTVISTTGVLINTSSSAGKGYIMLTSSGISVFTNVFYDFDRNILWNASNSKITRLECGTLTRGTDGIITEFNPKGVFRSTDYNEFLKTKIDLEQSISDVSSSVSTLDTNALHKSGNEKSTGLKNFQSQSGVYSDTIVKGTAPSSDTYLGLSFYDKNGTWTSANRLGVCQANYQTNGNARMLLTVIKPEAGSTSTASIGIVYESGGSTYATAPTPSSVTERSTKITTTQWIYNFLTTNDADAFSTWTKETKGGFKLANGLIVNWGRATAVTNTFKVPFSSNTSYSVSVAVGGDEQTGTSWGQVNTLTSTGFKVVGASSSRKIYWLAIGY